jgi:hypothetical protein
MKIVFIGQSCVCMYLLCSCKSCCNCMRKYYTGVTNNLIENMKCSFIYKQCSSVVVTGTVRTSNVCPLYSRTIHSHLWITRVLEVRVVRDPTQGSSHLRSAALDLTWFHYLLLDVIAVLALATVLILLILPLLRRVILKKLIGRNSHQENPTRL